MSTDAEALLRRFEPVVRYTKGNRFFPMDAEQYVRACSLWVRRPGGEEVCLVPHEKLTLERLGQPYRDEFGTVHYLRFTGPGAVQRLEHGEPPEPSLPALREKFHAGRGRLARVGYLSRISDALFSIGLLARGRVPGKAAAEAREAYGVLLEEDERFCYHGRVVRQDGWLVLQYWFLYAFNDWRSGFYGANDHEADWEKIAVYLSEWPSGELTPEWTAYSSHLYEGDMLRRRWDDPELVKVGEHPVVHVCAGSHSNQYAAGEYLTELQLYFLAPVIRLLESGRAFWRRTLRQYAGEEALAERSGNSTNVLHIPFVDYARGDGLSIGSGQEREWSPPRLLDPAPGWVSNYRGLWGLYTRDPFEGEDAPAGPMYERDGTVARFWRDPVGWAGLDKVGPPPEELKEVSGQWAVVAARRRELEAEIEEKTRELRGLGVEASAAQGRPHLRPLYESHRKRIAALSSELDGLRARLSADGALEESLAGYSGRLRAGERDGARDHLSHTQRPASETRLRASRLAEAWAATSIGLALIGLMLLVIYERDYLTFALALSIAVFLFVEAGFRGRIINLITSVTIGLAAVAALILLYEFFWWIVVAAVLLSGVYVLWDNLRELLIK